MAIRKLNNNYNVISANLKKYRKSENLSQANLVKELNLIGISIHKNDISLIEANKRTVKDYELWGFIKILNIRYEDLFEGIQDKLDFE